MYGLFSWPIAEDAPFLLVTRPPLIGGAWRYCSVNATEHRRRPYVLQRAYMKKVASRLRCVCDGCPQSSHRLFCGPDPQWRFDERPLAAHLFFALMARASLEFAGMGWLCRDGGRSGYIRIQPGLALRGGA